MKAKIRSDGVVATLEIDGAVVPDVVSYSISQRAGELPKLNLEVLTGVKRDEYVDGEFDIQESACNQAVLELIAATRQLRAALARVSQHAPGYDWNADPLSLTRAVGDAMARSDKAIGPASLAAVRFGPSPEVGR